MLCKKSKNCNSCLRNVDGQFRASVYAALTRIILMTVDQLMVVEAVNKECPALSVCPECRADDFTHFEGCQLEVEIERGFNADYD